MLTNILALYLSIIFFASISAADLYTDQEVKSSPVSVEMRSITCEQAGKVTTNELNNLEATQGMGDEPASPYCKICTKGKAFRNSCIANNKPVFRVGAAHATLS